MNLRHCNAVTVSKVIAKDDINEVKRLCFGGALPRTVFLKKCFVENIGKWTMFLSVVWACYSKSWRPSSQVDSLLDVSVLPGSNTDFQDLPRHVLQKQVASSRYYLQINKIKVYRRWKAIDNCTTHLLPICEEMVNSTLLFPHRFLTFPEIFFKKMRVYRVRRQATDK